MTEHSQRHTLSRRHLLRSMAILATVGPAAVIAACSSPAAPAQKPAEPAKPAAPAAAAGTPVPKAPEPASKVLQPTPTDIPLFTPVPQAAGTTKLLLRVHWSQPFYNDFQTIVSDYNATQGAQDKIYITLERFVANQAGPIATFIADYQAGTQEDIYHLDDNFFPDLAARKFFQAPPKEIQEYIKGNFLEKAVESGIWENQVMGYPTENQPHVLFMTKAGSPRSPTRATASASSASGCCGSSWPDHPWWTRPGRSRNGTSPRMPPANGLSFCTTCMSSMAAARRTWAATMSSGSSARAP